MGCSDSVEDKMSLTKLELLEKQVRKEQELKNIFRR